MKELYRVCLTQVRSRAEFVTRETTTDSQVLPDHEKESLVYVKWVEQNKPFGVNTASE